MDNGWFQRMRLLRTHICCFYYDLFKSSKVRDIDTILEAMKPCVLVSVNRLSPQQVTKEEVKAVVFYLGGWKALGSDGFFGLFHQSQYPIFEDDLYGLVHSFFASG